jgi:uncharacterized protein YecE (DUF72 family)
VYDPSPELLDAVFAAFLDGVEPLREAGKLGGVLLQFSGSFRAEAAAERRRNLAYIEAATDRLAGLATLVEFRHPSWVTGEHLPETLRFLNERGLHFVSVDSPQFPNGSTMPPVTAATAGIGYVRFHGRNRETFFKRTATAADRFDYLYEPSELREWEGGLRDLASETEVTYAMFNNCRNDYAPRNARQLAEILGDAVGRHGDGALPGDPGGGPHEGEQLGLGI